MPYGKHEANDGKETCIGELCAIRNSVPFGFRKYGALSLRPWESNEKVQRGDPFLTVKKGSAWLIHNHLHTVSQKGQGQSGRGMDRQFAFIIVTSSVDIPEGLNGQAKGVRGETK